MFSQFFGSYLFNTGLVTAKDLTKAFEDKKNTRMRLGVLAINAGLMTAEQVENVNAAQQSVDKRFGDLAVELGYITEKDVDKLLSQQPTDYLLLGQTLVNNGVLSSAQFEKAINDYKNKFQLSDEDITKNQVGKMSKLISVFYHFGTAEDARISTDYITMLLKNVIRFIGDDFTPLESFVVREFDAKYMVRQDIKGDNYHGITCIAADKAEYIELAQRFAKEKFNDVDDFVHATVGEFLNVVNGLFVVNESNEHGLELTMTPQEVITGRKVKFGEAAFCIPVAFGFGEVDFIISSNI